MRGKNVCMNISRRQMIAATGATLVTAHAGLRAAPSAGEFSDDIDIAYRALAIHPGLYRYQTPRQVEDRLARLKRDYVAAQSQQERFLLLSAFTATIQCGHSHCNPYNQKKTVVAALFDRPTKVPFEFDWLGRRMVVVADRTGTDKLPRGSEILSVDEVPPARMLERLVRFARADGANDAKRIKQMAMLGTDRRETFDIFQGLLFPPRNGVFQLRYRALDGRVGRGEFKALSSEQRQSTRHTLETDGTREPFWTWETRDGVATLTMPSWVMYNSKWNWEPWLKERLDSLKGAKGLIVDLRDNEGGNEVGNVILARLSPKDLDFAGYRQLVRYRRTPADMDRYLDTWDESFRAIGQNAKDVGNGFYDLGRETTDIIAAAGPRLTLPVAALIGPTCSSATFSFARRAQESGLVRLFGEPSGGNLRGINGNGYFFVRLPGSGLEFDVPIVGNFPVMPQPNRGVLPDVLVRPTVYDIAVGHDKAMAAARNWISRH